LSGSVLKGDGFECLKDIPSRTLTIKNYDYHKLSLIPANNLIKIGIKM